jgi:hypothetical protein
MAVEPKTSKNNPPSSHIPENQQKSQTKTLKKNKLGEKSEQH